MSATTNLSPARLQALRQLSLAEVQQRIDEIDAEREALVVIRKALAVRERSRERSKKIRESKPDGPFPIDDDEEFNLPDDFAKGPRDE